MPTVRYGGGKTFTTTTVEVDDVLVIGVKQGDGSYVDFSISIRNLIGQNVESLKDLTLAADKGLYATGANTLALFDLASAGRTFLGASTVLAQQQALDLEPGVDVQAYDADTAKLDVSQNWTAQQQFLSTVKIGDSSFDPLFLQRFVSSTSAQGFQFLKGRGTRSSPAQVLSGDNIARFMATAVLSGGSIPSASTTDDFLVVFATEDQTAAARGRKTTFYVVSNGTATRKAVITLEQDGTLTLESVPMKFGASQTIITSAGIVRNKPYTKATLPTSGASGDTIVISDGADTGDEVLAVWSTSISAWRRQTDGRGYVTGVWT